MQHPTTAIATTHHKPRNVLVSHSCVHGNIKVFFTSLKKPDVETYTSETGFIEYLVKDIHPLPTR